MNKYTKNAVGLFSAQPLADRLRQLGITLACSATANGTANQDYDDLPKSDSDKIEVLSGSTISLQAPIHTGEVCSKPCDECDEKMDPKPIKFPVIFLDARKYVVLDVDSDQALGEFHRRKEKNDIFNLPGAYCITDRGVLLVYNVESAKRAEYPSDARYERVSRNRGAYGMRALMKDGRGQRILRVLSKDFEELARAWNEAAEQAEGLGEWTQSIRLFGESK